MTHTFGAWNSRVGTGHSWCWFLFQKFNSHFRI